MDKRNITALLPGQNAYINTEKPKEDLPPDGFIDGIVRVYKLNPDGSKGKYLRDVPGIPDVTPEETKGEEEVAGKTEITNWEEIIARGMEIIDGGSPPFTAAKKLIEEYQLSITPQSVYPKLKKILDSREENEEPISVEKDVKKSRQGFDLGKYKLGLIDIIRDHGNTCCAPDSVTLHMIGLVVDASPERSKP